MKSLNDLGRNLFANPDMDRRKFLKTGAGLVAVAGGLEMIAGFATAKTPATGKSGPIEYPPLQYNKVQPPVEGCLVGLYKLSEFMSSPIAERKIGEIANRAKNIGEYVEMLKKERDFFESLKEKYPIVNSITYYEDALGARPFIFGYGRALLYGRFPASDAKVISRKGMVPYVTGEVGAYSRLFSTRLGLDEIARGQHDKYIKYFAQGAAKFGKIHGGFFFTTMIESNGNWWYWGQSPNLIPAWRHIWQIFEDEGANRYATWVWEAYNPYAITRFADDPERHYFGDKYVDWIGINTFSNDTNPAAPGQNAMFDELMHEIYRQMLKNHPQKPIMLSQFGRATGSDQPRWLINAFRSIKTDFPAIKAAIHHDKNQKIVNRDWTDSTLSPESLQALKEIFKDPYWIMAKKK